MLLDDFFGPPFPFEDRFRNDPAGLETAEEEEEEREEFSLADATASASVEGETAESSTREGRSRIEGTGLSERWGEYESSVKRRKRASRSVEGNGSSLHKEGRRPTLGCGLVASPRQLQQRREEAEQGRQDQVADALGDDAPDENGRDAWQGRTF